MKKLLLLLIGIIFAFTINAQDTINVTNTIQMTTICIKNQLYSKCYINYANQHIWGWDDCWIIVHKNVSETVIEYFPEKPKKNRTIKMDYWVYPDID